jgi:mono/diheme cytochrome c family protein
LRTARNAVLGLGLALVSACAIAQDGAKPFPAEQVKQGAELFARNCSTCHGNRMAKPEWAPVDLREFPRQDHARFVDTVTHGIRNMPPWSDVLKPGDIEALWAYVAAGEAKKP